MKHTTKPSLRTAKSAKKRMIGLRLDSSFMLEMEALAAAEQRSLADTARICVRIGYEQMKEKSGPAAGK